MPGAHRRGRDPSIRRGGLVRAERIGQLLGNRRRLYAPWGTTFAVGDSTAGCKASDAANNTTSCSFTIHVKGPAEQTRDLITMVNGLATASEIRNSLLAKQTAALARLQGKNPAAACGPLHASINEVNAQRGKSISASDADTLVTAAPANHGRERLQALTMRREGRRTMAS